MKGLGVLVLISFVVAEPPYPPSGWQPSGERLRLPIKPQRLQAPVPHAVYGPPPTTEASVETLNIQYLPPQSPSNQFQPPFQAQSEYGAPPQPQTEYGAPPPQPDNGYGPPQQPENAYGPPQQAQTEYGPPQPDSGYGPPQQQPDNTYGPPQQSDNGYGPPQQPNNNYGPPQQPDSEYGAPQQPDSEYGAPQQPDNQYGPPQQPDNGYGPPPQPEYDIPQGGLPVESGSSEKLRQNQFIQQLPLFDAARFRPQSQIRSQAQKSQNIRQPQRTQNLPQRNQGFQSQNFRQVPPKQTLSQFETFQSQRLPKEFSKANFQSEQLYTTPKSKITTTQKRSRKPTPTQPVEDETFPEEQGPNVAVATAFAGRYYVLQSDGLLQRVTYKLNNGQVTDGKIEPNLKYEDIAPLTGPVYKFNGKKLVRLNSR